MPSAGGHVPTQTVAPASFRAFAMAKPKPPSSATPATNARLPVRSIESMVLASTMRTWFLLALVLATACSRPKPAPAGIERADARFDFRPTAWESYPPEEAPKKHVVQ